jgi:hypothetical protein
MRAVLCGVVRIGEREQFRLGLLVEGELSLFPTPHEQSVIVGISVIFETAVHRDRPIIEPDDAEQSTRDQNSFNFPMGDA